MAALFLRAFFLRDFLAMGTSLVVVRALILEERPARRPGGAARGGA